MQIRIFYEQPLLWVNNRHQRQPLIYMISRNSIKMLIKNMESVVVFKCWNPNFKFPRMNSDTERWPYVKSSASLDREWAAVLCSLYIYIWLIPSLRNVRIKSRSWWHHYQEPESGMWFAQSIIAVESPNICSSGMLIEDEKQLNIHNAY